MIKKITKLLKRADAAFNHLLCKIGMHEYSEWQRVGWRITSIRPRHHRFCVHCNTIDRKG